MWTESGRMMRLVGVVAFALVTGCAGGDESTVGDVSTADVQSPANVPAAAEAPPAAEYATVSDLFPEGEGKEIVLNNCASCHAVACAAIGQRPANRWEDLAQAHAEHVPSLSDEQRQTAFAYLASNFSDQQPEPNVPSQFLERGCTPF